MGLIRIRRVPWIFREFWTDASQVLAWTRLRPLLLLAWIGEGFGEGAEGGFGGFAQFESGGGVLGEVWVERVGVLDTGVVALDDLRERCCSRAWLYSVIRRASWANESVNGAN